MPNRPKSQCGRLHVSTTIPGIKPGDFPVGSLKSRAAARAIVAGYAEERSREAEAVLSNLTPYEQEILEDDVNDPLVQAFAIHLVRVAQNTAKLYGNKLPLSTVEELRHDRAVRAEIDRLSGGNGSDIRNRDGIEWNRLKAIAEENLRREGKSLRHGTSGTVHKERE